MPDNHDESQSASEGGEFDDDNDPKAGFKTSRGKKAPTDAAARRDQNRIAQREFRQRKQQRIRDLEARCEILSATKEEAYSHTRSIIQGLMEENARLRGIVRELGGFMGDGLSGPLLQHTGMTMQQFHDFSNKADSDTMYESFMKGKEKNKAAASSKKPDSHSREGGRKRKHDSSTPASADPFDDPRPAKRASYSNTNNSSGPSNQRGRGKSPSDLPGFLPTNDAMRGGRDAPPSSFTSLVDTLNSSVAAPSVSLRLGQNNITHTHSNERTPPSMAGNFSSKYGPSARESLEPESRRTIDIEDNERKKEEAGRLITYHLDNARRNENYFLPASLRPTLVQRTIPHDPMVDGVIYPQIRDRMILLKDQFDIAKCITSILWTSIIHGDDVLDHASVELSEAWLREYHLLVDESTLAMCNKWRRTRGERELTMLDLNPEGVEPIMRPVH